jgi:hypothetical protein
VLDGYLTKRSTTGVIPRKEIDLSEPITITHSADADVPSVWRLAALDDRRPPHGPALLAYVNGELRAAVGLLDGHAVADPFHRTAEILELLRLQARQEVAA